jgi:hypothetical protein
MKILTRENLKEKLPFDVYYTSSLNLAYIFPHSGYLLTENIMLDGELIPSGTLLLYHNKYDEVSIITGDDKYNYTKIGYNEHMRILFKNNNAEI